MRRCRRQLTKPHPLPLLLTKNQRIQFHPDCHANCLKSKCTKSQRLDSNTIKHSKHIPVHMSKTYEIVFCIYKVEKLSRFTFDRVIPFYTTSVDLINANVIFPIYFIKRQKTPRPRFKPSRQISRRRSDGVVYQASSGSTRHNILDDDDDFAETDELEETDESLCEKTRRKRMKKSCHKCGKTKGDIRKHIERFRRQLETTTNDSEAEIKQQLQEFLSFLESRSRNSVDDGIDESNEANNQTDGVDSVTDGMTFGELEDDDYGLDDDTGIHVYGSNDDNLCSHQPRQFLNIHDFETRLVRSIQFPRKSFSNCFNYLSLSLSHLLQRIT